MKKVFLLLLLVFSLVGCSNEKINGEALYKTIEGPLAQEFVNNEKAILIDVRTLEEYEQGHLEKAINIPLDTVTKESIQNITQDTIDNIIVYCKSGTRSREAAIKIIELGYTNVYDLGSMDNWGSIQDGE